MVFGTTNHVDQTALIVLGSMLTNHKRGVKLKRGIESTIRMVLYVWFS